MSGYRDTWECPHAPGGDDIWQESDCYWFFDPEAGIGGYHRIGQYVNQGTGQTLLFAFRQDGNRFRKLGEFSAADCTRTDTGQTVGGSSTEFLGNGCVRFTWNEADSSGDLVFSDPFYTPRSWMAEESGDEGAGAVKQRMNTGGHLEVSGRIRGELRLGKEIFPVDALAHRDRSWGNRDYRAAYQHRMVTGTIGPELSWATYIMQLDNGHVARAGFVARNGITADISDVQVLAEIDYDGLSVGTLKTRLTLSDGTHVDLKGEAAQAFSVVTDDWLVSSHHFIPISGLGPPGFTIFDMTNRPSKGRYAPQPSEIATICAQDGLEPARRPFTLP